MRPDGGEARRITNAKDGVSDFAMSEDGKWLVYRAGREDARQLYRLAVQGESRQLLRRASTKARGEVEPRRNSSRRSRPVLRSGRSCQAGRASTSARQTASTRTRRPGGRSASPSTSATPRRRPRVCGRSISIRTGPARLTPEGNYSVSGVTVSDDGKWIGFRGASTNRYQRNITQANLYSDLYVLEAATGEIERLTNNPEAGESGPSFSPDGRWVAFSGPDDLTKYGMTNTRVYIRAVGDRGRPFRKLEGGFDGDVTIGFWSNDGNTIYFNEGIRATNQLFAIDVSQNEVRQITREPASLTVTRDDDSGALVITYADGRTPPTLFTVPSIERLSQRSAWVQLTDVNPQVRRFALGAQEEITWTSKDGTKVGGVLVKPVGYQPGQRYPLIVAIHGGPASADVLSFNGGYGSQVYAGAGYVVLRPNYRGSTNYGVKHKTDIVGDYFRTGFEDIMAGVDHLIAQGIADGSRMGALGWSAGGHWSNWILTHTDRFKAISSGAGTSNWISMYAQSDVQRNRQFYLGDKLPYDDFDAYWVQSPLKYIRNAKTPTMIHVVEGDPRVPSPQSVELHMALKQIGVPTELFMYPGNTHGIPDPRNQLVKAVSEMAWMDYYVRGRGEKFSWRDVLKTLEKEKGGGGS